MAFSSNTEYVDGAALITVAGELDASVAPAFRAEIEQAARQPIGRLVLLASGLDYIASAGLRVLLFARQKMGRDVEIYVVGAQEQIINVLQMTGFDRSCILQDTYA